MKKRSVEENGVAEKNKEEEERRVARDLAREMGLSATDSGELASEAIARQSQETSHETETANGGFNLTSKNQKRNRRNDRHEMQREQKTRDARTKIMENFLGKENKQQNKTIVISLENRADTLVNVEKATNLQITTVLASELDVRDIIEVRTNRVKKKATIQINSSNDCHQKSKAFTESIENNEEKQINFGGQSRWTASIIHRSSVGVVRGIPLEEDISSIKWYCKEMGYSVGEVRRLGLTATVVSIQFHGPLPDTVTFPFSFRNLPTRVDPYTPGPKKCLNCYECGHMTSKCEGPLRCVKCGGGHKADSCDNRTPKCPNCDGEHGPTSNECLVNKDKHKKKKNCLD